MRWKSAVVLAFVGGVTLGILLPLATSRLRKALSFRRVNEEQVTLTSLSPDDLLRVRLVEVPAGMIDRNFELRIENLADRTAKTVFRSPDEGLPEGSERILWASDGSRFVLVGRHFFTDGAPRLATGETLYLMYEVRSGRLWCNSKQPSRFPHFSLRDMEGTDWPPPLPPSATPQSRN